MDKMDEPIDFKDLPAYKIKEETGKFPDPDIHPEMYGLVAARLGISEIFNMLIEEQAKYADVICRHNVQVPGWVTPQLEISREEIRKNGIQEFYSTLNTTGIGNIAFVALNSPTESDRNLAKEILEQTISFHKYYRHWEHGN